MKGDFTRFTFQPAKHYTRVFMQQGRLQLDADWNEQMDIQAYLNLRQVQHMIGATAGTPGSGILKDGFKVTATPDGKDLIINPGQFYVGGVLCELVEGAKVTAIYLSEHQIQVPFLEIDGQPFAKGQWIQIFGDSYQIQEVNRDLQTLTLFHPTKTLSPPTGENKLDFFRLTTYLTQPDYPNPTSPENGKSYLVYLDVWQRHITAIEDPTIREIALADIPDTTTRVKTIWQIKLKELSSDESNIKLDAQIEDIEATKTWKQLAQSRQVSLTAQVKPTTNGLSDPRIGNQLYRVEIHKGGGLNEARFKWSRDNGTVVSGIKELRPQENAIVLPRPVRDTSQSFSAGQWVEISDEVRELNNQPGTLVRLKDVVVRTEDKLIFDPATIVGDPIDDAHFPIANKPKVRRWDWTQNEPGGLLVKFDWIDLENGIQVKFDADSESNFETGDYWLIPSRINPLKPLEWPQDSAKISNPLPQAPLGIYHQFGLLALAIAQPSGNVFPSDTIYWEQADKRTTFPPLINCFDKNGDTIPGPLGIGVKPPLAQLHVKGASAKTINNVSIQDGNSTITGDANSQFKANLHPGDLITIATSPSETQTRIVTEVSDNQTATVDQPFTASANTLNFQQPVLRLDTSNGLGNPQFLLNAVGNVGIGAIVPTAKLDVRGNFNVGIVDKDVKTGFFQVTPQKDAPVNLTSNKGYHFDKDITIESGVLRGNDQLALNTKGANRITILDSNGNVGIGFPDPQANLDIKGTAQVRTSKDPSTDPSTGFFKIEPQDNQPVQFTTNKGYHFDKDITIESGVVNGNNQLALNTKGTNRITILDSNGNVGIGFSDPQVNLDVKETLQIRTTKPSTDPTAGFFKVETKDDQPVQFTTNKGYHFNKDIAIESGNLAISTGFIQLGTDSKIQSIDKGIQISTSASNVQIALDNSLGETQVKFTSTNNTKYTFDGGIQVGTDASHVRVALDGSQVKFMTKDHTEYSFDQSINVNGITINSGVIHSPIQQLFLSGKTFIGDKGSSSPRVPDNGLLVAGNVGVGLPSPSNLGAKLEIESTQPTDNLNSFALNVQTGNSRLFSIRNNGDIFVSRRLLINTRADAITSPPLDKDIDVKLYVEGKVFGRDVTTGNIQVLSSRTLKQNIVELSSQEVDEVLRSLNPVKFTYKTDKDQTLHLGFIAEDVPEVVASSNRQTISPVDIVAALTKVVKDHRQAIVSLSKMVKEQQKAIATLTQKINELENNHR